MRYISIYIYIYLYIYVYILYTVPISELTGVRSLAVAQDQQLKQEALHINSFSPSRDQKQEIFRNLPSNCFSFLPCVCTCVRVCVCETKEFACTVFVMACGCHHEQGLLFSLFFSRHLHFELVFFYFIIIFQPVCAQMESSLARCVLAPTPPLLAWAFFFFFNELRCLCVSMAVWY